MCACVARKTRLETYVGRELESQIEETAKNNDMSVSEFLREAARKQLQREEYNDAN